MRIAVITAFRAGEVISFLREAALVKSASLYADAVEVLSFSSLVYTDWGAIPPEQAEQLRNAFITPTQQATSPRSPRPATESPRSRESTSYCQRFGKVYSQSTIASHEKAMCGEPSSTR